MANQTLKKQMPDTPLAKRLRAIMRERNLKPRAWSMAATGKPDTVRNMLRGKSVNPAASVLRKLGEAARVRFEYLLGDTDEMDLASEEAASFDIAGGRLRATGWIGAGDEVYPFGIGEGGYVEAPPGVTEGLAAKVKGTSMHPAYRPNDMVIAVPHRGDLQALVGSDCFVQVVDGPLYLKILGKGVDGRHTLLSYNPETKPKTAQKIEWAAPVRWVKRA